MMQVSLFFYTFLILIAVEALSSPYVPGSSEQEVEALNGGKGSNFLMNSRKIDRKYSKELSSDFVSGSKKNKQDRVNKQKGTDVYLPRNLNRKNESTSKSIRKDQFTMGKGGAVLDTQFGEEDIDVYDSLSKSIISFSYIFDSFEYTSENNKFDRIFRDHPESKNYGMFQISYDTILYKNWISFKLGGNIGIGHSSGRSSFSDGQSAGNARFALWTLPIDLGIEMEIALGRWIGLFIEGGPSVFILVQNRSDKDSSDPNKARRQYGYGYYGEGGLMLNFGRMIKSSMRTLFSEYGVSQLYIKLFARVQNVSKFKSKDITITGQSYGLGLAYSFM
ncbi:hypothetical protein OAB57_00725 [Bacteriovoracaceae bacterium]|nr:hypothetical protein [Bacteriovoracaceae bacterium]